MDRVVDIFPLTPAQAGLLVSTLREPEPGLYIVQMRFSLAGRLDVTRLADAWQDVVARHEMLRTAIFWDKTSNPVNVVMDCATMPIEELDLSAFVGEAQSEAVTDFLAHDRRRGFDLQHAPLSRITLIDFGSDDHEMVWTHHHLIIDGWSTARVMAELWSLLAGRNLSDRALGFREFAAALASTSTQRRADADAHWERVIRGDARIAVDRARSDGPADPWTECELPLDEERLERWDAAVRRLKTTRSTFVHAGWAMALRAAGLGPDELTFGTVADGRGADEAEVVGLCVASTPMRVGFPEVPVIDWLRDISVERAISQELAGNLTDHRRWSAKGAEAPFRYILAVEGYADAGLINPDVGDDLEVRYLGVRESTEFALTAGLPAGKPGLKLTIDTRRVSVDDAGELLGDWLAALDALAEAPTDGLLSDLLAAGPALATGGTVPERLRALAAADPDRPIFRDAAVTLTREELVRSSGAVAARLTASGVTAGDRVGVLADGTVGVPIAVLAILAVGGIVVPLDPRHPSPYQAAVIADAGVCRILTPHPDIRPDWAGTPVDSVFELGVNPWQDSTRLGSGRAGAAYLVYNGGSALGPRAAAYDHAEVLRSASNAATLLGLDNGDWTMSRTGVGALSPWEMWVAPLSGGLTVLPAASDEAGTADDREALLPVAGVAIDPADVERVLSARAGVASCIVRAEADRRLEAVVAVDEPLSARELTRVLRSALPERLVPQVKLAGAEGVPDAARQQSCEQDIRRLWSQVLDLRDVPLPLDTPFFDLGGDSLLLFAVLSGMHGAGWTEVTMTDLFAYPTVRSLSQRLSRAAPASPVPGVREPMRARRDAVAARRERRNR